MTDDFERLDGGNFSQVHRHGDRVLRETGSWTPAVHRLLRRLNDAGVPGIPKPAGFSADGREQLTFVHGTVPSYPMPTWVWTRTALESAAELLRHIHDVTAGADPEGPWRSPAHEPFEVICHNDFAPYNLVFDGSVVVGAIDWDFASPGPRLWDVAYLAYRIVPLTTAHDWGDGFSEAERSNRFSDLLTAYGTDAEPGDVVAVLRARLRELADFSERSAIELKKRALREHAALYRDDAAQLS